MYEQMYHEQQKAHTDNIFNGEEINDLIIKIQVEKQHK
jgi:hypothetical protein